VITMIICPPIAVVYDYATNIWMFMLFILDVL
jgi:hypothetical protein